MINFNTKINVSKISTDKLSFEILKSGDIYQIYHNHILVNLLKGNLLDGSLTNIYLRKKGKKIEYSKLIGVGSNSKYFIKDNKVIYRGNTLGVEYQVVLSVVDNKWFFDVLLEKNDSLDTFDLFYTQDVSVADKGMVQSSEAYTGQYVDHKVFNENNTYTILSRQNQGMPNLVQVGSFNKVNSFSTDGFQFFGLNYKETNIPRALLEKELENKNYQYEFPLIALQLEEFKLDENKEFTFYGMYVENHEDILDKPFEINKEKNFDKFIESNNYITFKPKVDLSNTISGNSISKNELLKKYQNVRNIEEDKHGLLSFFADDYKHIVTKEKELLVERPHGHIIIHGDILNASENVMASTAFINGIFASHIVLGNTNFHKLSGDVRNMLNVQKIAGLRIYLKLNNKYHLLTLASYFEINTNLIKWVYILDNDILEINYFAGVDQLEQSLTFKSLNNIQYDILITEPILMGDVENAFSIDYKITEKEVVFKPKDFKMVLDRYPNLKYKYLLSGNVEVYDDSYIFGDDNQYGMLVLKYNQTSDFRLDLIGTLEEEFAPSMKLEMEDVIKKSNKFYHQILPLEINTKANDKISAFNDLTIWYIHNALVHYSSPHGLEQFNGAAWGTRDVCQGPFELFMTAQRFDLARKILLKTFERQFIETGDYPQWFMFDKYYFIQAHDSHGDIIVWPLKALSNYLEVTNDLSILDEKISYMSLKTNEFTEEKYSVIDHINKALDRIRDTEIKNVPFPAYGGGDWNDTLQPANQELTKVMVSTWTVSLLYQSLTNLLKYLPLKEIKLIDRIRTHQKDLETNYYKYLLKDNIPTGFTIFDNDKISNLLHPSDQTTGIKYRLLSFNRGIISELLNKDSVYEYLNIIDKNLKHPDGVRLMNEAVRYNGGKRTYFMRAETATNFGREVGLNYIHAHIRYIEAMTKLGEGERVLEALTVINPINITKNVKNALYRQSNAYFSSSDGYFYDRYIAQENFDKLRTGDVLVKAGWRIYSSGPGIYLNQLITNTLGIKIKNNDLVIDPVLSKEFDKVEVNYKYFDKVIKVIYKLSNDNSVLLNGNNITKRLPNKYKNDSFVIDKELLRKTKDILITVNFKA